MLLKKQMTVTIYQQKQANELPTATLLKFAQLYKNGKETNTQEEK